MAQKKSKARLIITIEGNRDGVLKAISDLSSETNTAEKYYGVKAEPDVE